MSIYVSTEQTLLEMYFTAGDMSILYLSLPSPEVFWRKRAYFTGGTQVEFIFMNNDNKHQLLGGNKSPKIKFSPFGFLSRGSLIEVFDFDSGGKIW